MTGWWWLEHDSIVHQHTTGRYLVASRFWNQCWNTFQWPFQEPKLEVPTIYKAYFSGLCKRISLDNMARNIMHCRTNPSIGSWDSDRLDTGPASFATFGCLEFLFSAPASLWGEVFMAMHFNRYYCLKPRAGRQHVWQDLEVGGPLE